MIGRPEWQEVGCKGSTPRAFRTGFEFPPGRDLPGCAHGCGDRRLRHTAASAALPDPEVTVYWVLARQRHPNRRPPLRSGHSWP